MVEPTPAASALAAGQLPIEATARSALSTMTINVRGMLPLHPIYRVTCGWSHGGVCPTWPRFRADCRRADTRRPIEELTAELVGLVSPAVAPWRSSRGRRPR